MLNRSYRKVLLFFFLSLILCVNSLETAKASSSKNTQVSLQEASLSSCSNLDVIFIIDQSASMGGESGGSANDPTNQRKNAVDGMVDLLVDLAMDQCAGSYHRIGVISFGDEEKTRIDLPLSDISPRSPSEAQTLRRDLKAKVLADNLGQTYPEQAFKDAWEMFEFSASAGGSDEPRKQVILFVTDGFPCLPGGACDPNSYEQSVKSLRELVDSKFDFAANLKQREICLSQLRSLYGELDIPAADSTGCLESNPVSDDEYRQSTYIFTILLRNSGERVLTLAQDVLAQMSEDYAGQLISLRRNAEDIPTTLRQILSQLAGVRPNLLECGGFAVNPYLKKAIITAYKTSPGVEITLSYSDANNKIYTIQGGGPAEGFIVDPETGYYVFGANERYEFATPYPGIWQLTSTNCDGIDVYYDEVEISPTNYAPVTQIPQFDREPYYNSDDPYYLEYQLLDSASNGAVVTQSDKEIFSIDVVANVISPNGEQNRYSLPWDAVNQTFRADKPLLVPMEGTYRYSIVGTTRHHIGEATSLTQNESQVFDQTYELFKVENAEFTAQDVFPVEISPVSPVVNGSIGNVHDTLLGGWPLKKLPLAVRIRLVDESGNVMTNVNDLLVAPDNSIRVTLKYAPPPSPEEQGLALPEQVSQPIVLVPDPDKPGEFIGTIADLSYVGLQTLVLDISSESLKPGFWVYDRSIEVPFTRTDCALCRTGTYYIILAIIIVILLAMIIYNIAIRTNKISGTLTFVDGSTNIAEFGLYSGVNFRKIKKRELDGYPQLMLKSMKAKNIGKKRRTAKQDDGAAGAFYSDEQQGIRIDCVSSSGRKYSVDLNPKTPSVYSEETFAQMVYEPIE